MSSLPRSPTVALCALLGGLAVANAASAHGLYPAASSVVVGPSSSQLFAGTNFGAVISSDSGTSWNWICQEVLGEYSLTFSPVFRWTPTGKLYAALPDGLAVSGDGGCSWARNGAFVGRKASDVAFHSEQGGTVYATSSPIVSGGLNGLWRSIDDGQTFERTALQLEKVRFTSVRIAHSNAQRLYVAAQRVDDSQALLFRTDDAGATHSELPSGQALGAVTPYVLGVSPVDADTVFVTVGDRPSVLLRSTDAGETFVQVAEADDRFHSFESSPDGATVWAASYTRLFRSRDAGATFTRLEAPAGDACIARRGGELYACGSPLANGWELGHSPDEGDTWSAVLSFTDLKGPTQCPAGSDVATTCPRLWANAAANLGINLYPRPAVTPDAGTTPEVPRAGGCAASPAEDAGSALAGLGAVALLLASLSLAARRARVEPLNRRQPCSAEAAARHEQGE